VLEKVGTKFMWPYPDPDKNLPDPQHWLQPNSPISDSIFGLDDSFLKACNLGL
jgi:hypothetical protein